MVSLDHWRILSAYKTVLLMLAFGMSKLLFLINKSLLLGFGLCRLEFKAINDTIMNSTGVS